MIDAFSLMLVHFHGTLRLPRDMIEGVKVKDFGEMWWDDEDMIDIFPVVGRFW
jgi:hypothetical protein